MRLGTKIIIGFFYISLLLAFIGFISDRFTSQVREEQLSYVNEVSSVVIYTGEMERNLYQSLIFLNTIRETISHTQTSNVQEYPSVNELTAQYSYELEQFEESYKKFSGIQVGDKQLSESAYDMMKSYGVYNSLTHQWLKLVEENSDQANLMYITSIEPYFRNNIIPQIAQLRTHVLSLQEERNQTLNDSLKMVSTANGAAIIFSLIMAVFLGGYIYRSIAKPLTKLNETATKIGEGSLDERIDIKSNDELGLLANTINKMAANLQKKTVSKDYVDNIIESIQEALFVTDVDGILKMVNSSASRLLGFTPEEMLGRPINEFYDFKQVEHRQKNNAEYFLLKKNGGRIPVLFSEVELFDTQGALTGGVTVASDISERIKQEEIIRASLKEKEVLLAEVHHRVKNNLAVISGLLQLQGYSEENKEVEKALSDSQMRIQSIALVHEMLYEDESLAYIQYDLYVDDLIKAIKKLHVSPKQNISVKTDVSAFPLSVTQAIPFSLLLNEWILNVFKTSFEKQNDGEIHVSIQEVNDQVTMSISDTGAGFNKSAFDNSNSLGSTLIKTLTRQLQGEYRIDSSNSGTLFQVGFQKVD